MPVQIELQPYKEMILMYDIITIVLFLIALLVCLVYVIKIIFEKKTMFNIQSLSFLSWLVGFFALLLIVFFTLGTNGLFSLVENEYLYLTTLSLFGIVLGSCSFWIFKFVLKLSGIKLFNVFGSVLLSSSILPVLIVVYSFGFFDYAIGLILLILGISLVVYLMSKVQNWLERKGQ